jgi:23S rRNA pseudouridine1911/1915/1917 synthase
MGDKIYGLRKKKDLDKDLEVSRQMLHAQQLGFDHPQTGRRMEFSASLPMDMERVIAWLINTQTP